MKLFKKELDRSTPIPLYFQLKSIILEDIKNNAFAVGDAIPTERTGRFLHTAVNCPARPYQSLLRKDG